MVNSALPYPNLLTDPGFLYWAPIGSTQPTHTVTGSVFTDSWPVAWIPMGMTDSGSDFGINTTVSPIVSAEQLEPIAYRSTDRTGQVSFMLKSITAMNLSRAWNGAVTTVTGSTTTTLTKVAPTVLGQEVRSMIGWESLDSTMRWIAYQVFNSGDVKLQFNKAPANAAIPWTGMIEKPQVGDAWNVWTAGVARQGI